MKRIWIIPVNDGEAVTTRDYLRRAGEVVITSGQPWGASWARLEPEVVETITKFKDEHPDGIVYGEVVPFSVEICNPSLGADLS